MGLMDHLLCGAPRVGGHLPHSDKGCFVCVCAAISCFLFCKAKSKRQLI